MAKVRPYSSTDREAVIRLWRECSLVRSPNDPGNDIDGKWTHDPGLFVAVEANHPVGSVMAGFDGHRGWINYLAVSPARQRRGVGTLLLQRAEEYLAGLGCEKINLQVRTNNLDVISFYERAGYLNDAVVSLGKRLVLRESANPT